MGSMAHRFFIFLLLLLTSCSGHSQQIILLDYQDFGPQVIAHEVIGMEWWQWQNHGDSDPATTDDIKVAVYRDIPIAEAQKNYPVDPEKKRDVRYLEYQKALGFLDEKIGENVQESVTETLRATRKRITNTLRK
ncbi:MAG: hypothetical protein D3923_11665 [Candidatus Electrothrix sp. AR3]|nr:hypothetical protein [Candidatus Electrothrix sp. AR3]